MAFTGKGLIHNVLLIRQLIQHREQMKRFLLEGSSVSCTTRKARDDEIECVIAKSDGGSITKNNESELKWSDNEESMRYVCKRKKTNELLEAAVDQEDRAKVVVDFPTNSDAIAHVEGRMLTTGLQTTNELDYRNEIGHKELIFFLPNIDTHVASGDHVAIGRWGEALVYQFLLLSRPEDTIEWVNAQVLIC